MANKRYRAPKSKKLTNPHKKAQTKSNNGGNGVAIAGYEQSREQRIKENQQRMEKLGLFNLTRNLKPPPKQRLNRKKSARKAPPQSGSPRRSSRLKTERMEDVEISTNEDSESEDSEPEPEPEPEVYTEEHVKLVGDCKTSWTLRVDGFDEDGNRINHSSEGKCCHHCKYKTPGHITECSKCKNVQGQLCGDCLYMRYGENIIEVNENKDWVCPACRGICNCSVCRRANGWRPTGTGVTYKKVTSLGFKSVAHYLIHTRGPLGNQLGPAGAGYVSGENSLPKLLPQLDKKIDENMKVVRTRHDRKHICYDSEPDEKDDGDDESTEDAHDFDYEPEEQDDAADDDDELTEEE